MPPTVSGPSGDTCHAHLPAPAPAATPARSVPVWLRRGGDDPRGDRRGALGCAFPRHRAADAAV
ncbi:hypothetical protein DSI35_10215, partial [Mycobacterium tuberculosis]